MTMRSGWPISPPKLLCHYLVARKWWCEPNFYLHLCMQTLHCILPPIRFTKLFSHFGQQMSVAGKESSSVACETCFCFRGPSLLWRLLRVLLVAVSSVLTRWRSGSLIFSPATTTGCVRYLHSLICLSTALPRGADKQMYVAIQAGKNKNLSPSKLHYGIHGRLT